jgi:hemin uptake protein HemP
MTDSIPQPSMPPTSPLSMIPTAAASAPAPTEPPRIESTSLFQGSRVVVISHAGESYRLLLTRNNRLILQK